MKRLIAPALAAALALLAVAVVNASAGHGKGRHMGKGGALVVVERATTDAVTNGEAADTAGNILTFANEVFDATNTRKIGRDQGSCVRTVVGQAWECAWTTFLPAGQITVQGPFSDTGNSVLSVTGGTGAYRNVRGEMELRFRNPAGTEFDFVFHLIG
jgi:Allene oxide cyclase barrel like domain